MNTSRTARSDTPAQSVEQTIFMKRAPIDMPVNLAEWLAPKKIGEWIREAIQNLDCSKPGLVEFLQQGKEERSQSILGVLVFSYLTQRFGSREIYQGCHADPVLKQLCGGKPPEPEELDHFRRKHRGVLGHVLGQVLVRTVQEKFPDAGRVPPGLEHGLFMRAIDQLDIARHMSTWEE